MRKNKNQERKMKLRKEMKVRKHEMRKKTGDKK